MILTTHQPIFLPWPGLFYKAMRSDCLVLLDDVQFPRGRTWLNRNRLKNENGELWLTAPVWKKGRGLQVIREVELCDERGWRKKHLRSIEQNYTNAPYLNDHFPGIESIYHKHQSRLAEFNLDLIRFFWKTLSFGPEPILQSDLGIKGKGTELLVAICGHVGADRYAMFTAAEKHLDIARMRASGIEPVDLRFRPPVYPQLWGGFIYNLSVLDLLLNCGSKSAEIIARA